MAGERWGNKHYGEEGTKHMRVSGMRLIFSVKGEKWEEWQTDRQQEGDVGGVAMIDNLIIHFHR